jgi:AcrR family transcriptional regulator
MKEDKPDLIGSWSIKEGLDEILENSCRLMAKQGFHGTSMRDLAHATGRSLSGLYHYFRSKEDLLFIINFYGFATLNDTWKRASEGLKDPNERLYAFIYFHTSYYVEHMDEMRIMTWGTHALNLEKAKLIQKLKDRYTHAVKEVVSDAYQAAFGEEIEEKRLDRETYILFGMMNWIFSWYSTRKHGNTADLIGDIYRTFTLGISGGNDDRSDMDAMEKMAGRLFERNKTTSMWHSAG